jgi:hypothetical protein
MGLHRLSIFISAVLATLSACRIKRADVNQNTHGRPAPAFATPDMAALNGFEINSNLPFGNNGDAMMAVAMSGFGRSLSAKIFAQIATEPGVLPQMLVPSVRSEVKSNGMLSILQNIPFGLGSSLMDTFASDAKLTEKVREGLTEKLNTGLARFGGSSLGSRMMFNFDHFSRARRDFSGFDFQTQAAQWNLMWSEDGFWTGGIPLDGRDHGLQLLGVLRTLSEWAYVYGLGGSGEISGFGGLLQKWSRGVLSPAKPVLPADLGIREMILAGRQTVSVPKNLSALDLATQGGEQWQSESSPLVLIDQATIWLAGAKAFGRLRADRRTNAPDLFVGVNPVISSGAAQLPLLFLNSMGMMLNGPFINAQSQKIFMQACPNESCDSADARSIVRLVAALSEWIEAANSIETAGLPPEIAAKVKEGLPKLKVALQLAVRILMGELTEDTIVGSQRWLTVVQPALDGSGRSSVSAEVIGTLAYVERNILKSDILKSRITALANGHAQTFFRSKESLTSKEAVLWNARMIRELERSKFSTVLPWLDKVQDSFSRAIGSDWVQP